MKILKVIILCLVAIGCIADGYAFSLDIIINKQYRYLSNDILQCCKDIVLFFLLYLAVNTKGK